MERKNKEREIDLKKIFFNFKAKWYYFALSVPLALLLGFIVLKSSPEQFSFKSTLLLGQQNTGSRQAQELLTLLDVKDKSISVEDELGVVTSYEMISKALNRLDFNVSYHVINDSWINRIKPLVVKEVYDQSPFRVILDTGAVQLVGVPIYLEPVEGNAFRLRAQADKGKLYNFATNMVVRELENIDIDTIVSVTSPIRNQYLNLAVLVEEGFPKETTDKHYFVVRTTDQLAKSYQSRLQAKPISRDSRIIALSIEGSVPKKEIRFLNTLMGVYIERDLEEKNATGMRTVDFLEDQIGQIADSLKLAESRLANFRSANGLANVGVQSSIHIQQIEQLQAERDALQANEQFFRTTLSSLRNSSDLNGVAAPTTIGGESAVLNSLIIKLNEHYTRRTELSANMNRSNPLLETLDEQILNTKAVLRDNLNNLLRSNEVRLRQVDQRIARAEDEIRKVPENERQLVSLQSKSAFNDANYDFLLQKRTEAAISLATNVTDKKVVDQADMVGNGPTSPKKGFILMVALLIGFALPAGLIMLLDSADDTIKSVEDIKSQTKIPFIGAIAATDKKGSKLVMIDKPRSAIAESFRSLRINLQFAAGGGENKVIGITSTLSGEGKSFCSVNLASELAISGKRTLLIETDLRRPTVRNYFVDYPEHVGLSTHLDNKSTLDDIIQKSPVKNLDIIASGPIPPNPIELIGSPEMDRLLNSMKEHYDYIVLDIPPVGFVSEYLILLPYIDVNLYVMRQKYTQKNLIDNLNELHTSKSIRNMYVILNDVNYNSTYEYSYKKKGEYYYS